jgi:hypothetical protein
VEPYIDTALMIAIGIIMEEETTTERERPYITGRMRIMFTGYTYSTALGMGIRAEASKSERGWG